jgi:hypothetical protein
MIRACNNYATIFQFILGKSDLVRGLLEEKDEKVTEQVHRMLYQRRSLKQGLRDDQTQLLNPAVQLSGDDCNEDDETSVDLWNSDLNAQLIQPVIAARESRLYREGLIQAVLDDPRLLNDALRSPKLHAMLFPHKLTLFITIYCSILQGSFITLVKSSGESTGVDVVLALFYMRLFFDLLGRPLALLPKPAVFKTINAILYWTIFRFFMAILFFLYISVPERYFYRNDWGILVFQVSLSRKVYVKMSYVSFVSCVFCSVYFLLCQDTLTL